MGVPMDVRAQFAELTTPHLAAAYNLAFWITRSRADAEDVVQDAYLRAWRGFGGFRGGPMLPWLLAIVRNAAYRWMSTHRHAGNVVSLDTLFLGDDGMPGRAMQIAADTPTAEAAMIAASENAHVMRALASLPPARNPGTAGDRGHVLPRYCADHGQPGRHRDVAPVARAPGATPGADRRGREGFATCNVNRPRC